MYKTKYLGIQIDELGCAKQSNQKKSKGRPHITSLSKLKDIVPQFKLAQVYTAFLRVTYQAQNLEIYKLYRTANLGLFKMQEIGI